jgi:threonyl-tRNA synthetase
LIEHFAGEFPFAIAPTQVIFIPISDDHKMYAKELANELMDLEIDSKIFDKNESLNKRVRNAEKQKVPMIVVLGDDEVKNSSVAIRDRRNKEQYNLTKDGFIKLIKEKMSEVSF